MACDPEQGTRAVHNNSDLALETPANICIQSVSRCQFTQNFGHIQLRCNFCDDSVNVAISVFFRICLCAHKPLLFQLWYILLTQATEQSVVKWDLNVQTDG